MLTAITKDVLPNTFVSETAARNSPKKNLKLPLDHEIYALNLENALMSHFKYSEPEYGMKCVWSRRNAYEMEHASNEKVHTEADTFCPSAKRGLDQRTYNRKSQGYVIYVSYRLEVDDTKIISVAGTSGSVKYVTHLKEMGEVEGTDGNDTEGSMDSVSSDMELEEELHDNDKIFEDYDEKQLSNRMETLEEEHKELQEKIKKLDHGRMWMENRLSALESTNQHQLKDEIAETTNVDHTIDINNISVRENDSYKECLDKNDKGFKQPGSSLKNNQK